MSARDNLSPLRDGTLDAELAALLWLLVEGGVPLIIAGEAEASRRRALAADLLSLDPRREWVVLEVDEEAISTERVAALLRGGIAFALSLAAPDLESVMARLVAAGLPEDGVRRLGMVAITRETGHGLRLAAVHYLRPTERDAHGHIQRRPPAVLAAWDDVAGAFDHYAWGVTPELAARVDRSQADLEQRQQERALFLAAVAAERSDPEIGAGRISRYLATEPPGLPATPHPPARTSPFHGGIHGSDHDHDHP